MNLSRLCELARFTTAVFGHCSRHPWLRANEKNSWIIGRICILLRFHRSSVLFVTYIMIKLKIILSQCALVKFFPLLSVKYLQQCGTNSIGLTFASLIKHPDCFSLGFSNNSPVFPLSMSIFTALQKSSEKFQIQGELRNNLPIWVMYSPNIFIVD